MLICVTAYFATQKYLSKWNAICKTATKSIVVF